MGGGTHPLPSCRRLRSGRGWRFTANNLLPATNQQEQGKERPAIATSKGGMQRRAAGRSPCQGRTEQRVSGVNIHTLRSACFSSRQGKLSEAQVTPCSLPFSGLRLQAWVCSAGWVGAWCCELLHRAFWAAGAVFESKPIGVDHSAPGGAVGSIGEQSE